MRLRREAGSTVPTSVEVVKAANQLNLSPPLRGWDFEHILKVMTNDPSPSGGEPFFTESLILAQDERWRRA